MNSKIWTALNFFRDSVRPVCVFLYIPIMVAVLYFHFDIRLTQYFHIGDTDIYGHMLLAFLPTTVRVLGSFIVKLVWEFGNVIYERTDDELCVTYTLFHLVEIHTSSYKWSELKLIRSNGLGVFLMHEHNAMFIPKFAADYAQIRQRLNAQDVIKGRFYTSDLPRTSMARTLRADLLEQVRLGLQSGLKSDCVRLLLSETPYNPDIAVEIVNDVERVISRDEA